MATFFPELKENIQNEKETYESFREATFAKEFILPSQQPQMSSSSFYFNLMGVIILTLFAGCMSGLTVGYTSIDTLVLEVKISNGTEEEKYYAKKILSIVSNHHWLLTTLLFFFSIAHCILLNAKSLYDFGINESSEIF